MSIKDITYLYTKLKVALCRLPSEESLQVNTVYRSTNPTFHNGGYAELAMYRAHGIT